MTRQRDMGKAYQELESELLTLSFQDDRMTGRIQNASERLELLMNSMTLIRDLQTVYEERNDQVDDVIQRLKSLMDS